jgi:endonuclease YncB( thermonuclease family)
MGEHVRFSRSLRLVAIALAAAIFVPSPSPVDARPGAEHAALVSGRATVIDGDTLDIAGERVRLEGIDAPEVGQTCGGGWFGTWACGSQATAQLRWLVGARRVDCSSAGRDKYGRVLGWCTVAGQDINAEMVRSGFAWAFVKYSARYQAIEADARKAKVGVWKGDAQPPWLYRESRWQFAEADAPKGCAIKGNITENGHIYHMPWSPWYARVKVEPAKGEQWFCSEEEASKAGFRPVVGN